MLRSFASGSRYRWVILGVCWLGYIVAFSQRLSIGPLAPFLKEDLALTNTQIGSLVSATALGYVISIIPAGWLVDRVGTRWVLALGEVIAGIFLTAMSSITSFTLGAVFMALAGIGLGCVMPATTKAVLIWFPVKERATAMGFKQTGVNVGGIISAATLPALALAFGWGYGFVAVGLVGIAIGIVSFIVYREPAQSIDHSQKQTVSSTLRSSAGEVFKGREIWLISLAGMCLVAVEFSILAHFVLYLKEVLLFAVVAAGFLLAMVEAGGAFGKPVSGLISDYLFHGGRKRVYILIAGVAFAMCMLFSLLQQGVPPWILVPVCLILGLVAIGFGGLHLTLVGEIAGKELAGTVTGMSAAITMIGSVIGPPVFGYVVDTTGSYRLGWQLLAVLAVVAVVLLLFVREGKRRI